MEGVKKKEMGKGEERRKGKWGGGRGRKRERGGKMEGENGGDGGRRWIGSAKKRVGGKSKARRN